MKLDEKEIEEFKELYFKEYGIQLTNQQAFEYGSRLIRLVRAVYGNNLPTNGFDNSFKKDNNNIELRQG